MSTSKLTAEQQRRIEESKRKALERLARKRATIEPTNLGPPNKKPSLNEAAATYSSHNYGSRGEPSTSYTTTAQPRGSHHVSRPEGPCSSTRPTNTKSKEYIIAPRKKIKAVLTLTSRRRFKVVASFDSRLVEQFKRIPSKSYDATSHDWYFGIEHYFKLVSIIRSELSHIDLDLIPKAVINLFLGLLKTKNKSDSAHISDMSERIPNGLLSTLMQFQLEGVEYCIKREGRALIADDMGLGKTLQAIAVVCYYQEEWPLLVVCPASMKVSWQEAFRRWVPSLAEGDINVVMTTKDASRTCPVNIISYDLLVKSATVFKSLNIKVVIIDESHFLKNYKTARAKAALPIVKKSRRAILLSGTPALSRPIELFSQITSVDTTFFMKLVDFGKRYCNGVHGKFGWDFSGSSNMSELQLYMEERMMIRRLKSEVLDQLPTKRRQMVVLNPSMTKRNQQDWDSLHTELEKVFSIDKPSKKHSLLLPLFSKTGQMKIPAVRDYILDLLEGGRKLIVFAHHRSMMEAICSTLSAKKYKYIKIDGGVAPEHRQEYCDRFQHDDTCVVAVLSITAANTGLTLTAASTVIFAELFWNPGALVQAEDRAYRIGQRNSVNIHYLVAQDTADDFMWPLIQKKLNVLNQAGLSGEDFSKADSTHRSKELFDETQLTLDDFFDMEDDSTSSGINSTDKLLEQEVSGDTNIINNKKMSLFLDLFSDEESFTAAATEVVDLKHSKPIRNHLKTVNESPKDKVYGTDTPPLHERVDVSQNSDDNMSNDSYGGDIENWFESLSEQDLSLVEEEAEID